MGNQTDKELTILKSPMATNTVERTGNGHYIGRIFVNAANKTWASCEIWAADRNALMLLANALGQHIQNLPPEIITPARMPH